jgi:putative membrane protein
MHGMMGNMTGVGSGMFFLMTVFWLAVLVLVILAIIYLIRNLRGGGGQRAISRETPLDILKRRYAEGKIDKNEFEEKARDIG